MSRATTDPELVRMGQKITKRREVLDMTQGQLAVAVGVTQQTISRIEQGRVEARLPLRRKIARELGMSAPSSWGVDELDADDDDADSELVVAE